MMHFIGICFAATSATMLTIQSVSDASRHILIAGDMKLSRLPGWERNSWGYHGDVFFGGGGGEEWDLGVSSSAPILF